MTNAIFTYYWNVQALLRTSYGLNTSAFLGYCCRQIGRVLSNYS